VKKSRLTILQLAVHLAGWFPLALIIYDYFNQNLTANPIQAVEQRTGIQALTFLMASLACTPLVAITGWKSLTLRRKALGNYGFMYAALHVFTFFVIDYGLDLGAVWRDVGTKIYIILGAAAFLMLLPVAVTSFRYWMKRMGKQWKQLHRLVYLISPLIIFHFILVVKGSLLRLQGNLIQPLLYGGIVILLLIIRIPVIKRVIINLRTRITDWLHGSRLQRYLSGS
jgi:sulfoxide reductase heme-binding subunit YedZ